MTHPVKIIIALIFCAAASNVSAQNSSEKILPLDGHVAGTGTAIELNWFDADPPRVGTVSVKRRRLGETGAESWSVIGPALGPVMRFTDNDITRGVAYEYQVLRSARDIIDVGYWSAGHDIPARATRGTAHLVIDDTVAQAIAPHLARFEWDLIGDGWQTIRYQAPRGEYAPSVANVQNAQTIKNQLREAYLGDPFGQHTIILIGHVPLMVSGRANPDGHDPVAHATDLFYAEIDGQWRANPEGVLLHNQVPSDFIEMQIGRIDFFSVSGGSADKEHHLLRAYFDKNHHWRMQALGDLRNAYGQSEHLRVEQAALRNIVGATSVTKGGHHDAGEQGPWLWGVDFGDWNGARYAEDFANKAVFAINFGSGKQKIERGNNAMAALLAQPWYTLAVGWGGRPAWQLHHMALGGTIGDVHMRTVNNGSAAKPYRETMEYYPTGNYLWRNPIWVNLLGDPTLHAFVLAPPTDVRVQNSDQGTRVSWTVSTDPNVIGYKVYRARPGSTRFEALHDTPLTSASFVDTAPAQNARYMIRAYGKKDVYAGSFFTLSQGAFSAESPVSEPEFLQKITLSAPAGQPVALPDAFRAQNDAPLYAPIHAPAIGTLSHDGTNWIYTPPVGFSGTVDIAFSVSLGAQNALGLLTLDITKS